MKILHSFWSKPFLSLSARNEKSYGGWREAKYHYISWALSCLSCKSVYGEIELVTDERGKEVFIDHLGLPYTSVRVELDLLNHYPEQLWAVGKLYAYSLQNAPFIHVDGDVFLWSRFAPKLEKAELLGQHVDNVEGHYHFGLAQLEKYGIQIPEVMKRDFEKQKRFKATNAGIIGGNCTDFFKEYAERAFRFIDDNLNKIDASLIGSSYAIIYEQYLFSVMARQKGITVQHYLDSKERNILQLTNFMRKYGKDKFVHLLGDSKSQFEYCREMELQLRVNHSEYYERIMKFLKSGKYA